MKLTFIVLDMEDFETRFENSSLSWRLIGEEEHEINLAKAIEQAIPIDIEQTIPMDWKRVD